MTKTFTRALLVTLFTLATSSAVASAGWYPTSKGQTLTVEYCLPKAQMGTLVLRGTGAQPIPKILAKIKDPILKRDSYCADDLKRGYKQGAYHFRYSWKVNVTGQYGLDLYSNDTKKKYYGWPDGIDSH